MSETRGWLDRTNEWDKIINGRIYTIYRFVLGYKVAQGNIVLKSLFRTLADAQRAAHRHAEGKG